jgi:hypothetical protein
MPVYKAGIRTDPPKSVPSPIGEAHDEITLLSPPDEPPGDLRKSYGFLVMPFITLYVSHLEKQNVNKYRNNHEISQKCSV